MEVKLTGYHLEMSFHRIRIIKCCVFCISVSLFTSYLAHGMYFAECLISNFLNVLFRNSFCFLCSTIIMSMNRKDLFEKLSVIIYNVFLVFIRFNKNASMFLPNLLFVKSNFFSILSFIFANNIK